MRYTTNPATAVERLGRELVGVTVTRTFDRHIEIAMGSGAGVIAKRPIKALAFVADLAVRRRLPELRERVRWTGLIPAAAKGWERAALEAVQTVTPLAPRVRMARCTYNPGWHPLGRARTRCPKCGAVLGDSGHPVELREVGA